jgi:arsenate reductase
MANVLFVCLHNAGRSQMSKALFDRSAEARHASRCAGTEPGERIHPAVLEAMAEVGIELSGQVPRKLTREDAEWADVVVTMGCGDACPYIPGKRYLAWELDDPKDLPLAEVRQVRDEIQRRAQELAAELSERSG